MIRVHTPVGIEPFEEADAYSLGTVGDHVPPDRGSPLRLWKLDSTHQQHRLIALFAPGGWFGLDFKGAGPAREIGFVPGKGLVT